MYTDVSVETDRMSDPQIELIVKDKVHEKDSIRNTEDRGNNIKVEKYVDNPSREPSLVSEKSKIVLNVNERPKRIIKKPDT